MPGAEGKGFVTVMQGFHYWRALIALLCIGSGQTSKWWSPRLAVDAAHQALLTFGQLGYSEEFPDGQRMHDLMGMEIGDGTAQVAKLVEGLKPEHDGGEDHSAAVVQDGLVVARGQAAPLVVPATDLVGALRDHHGDLAGP